jgi:hypothetical protein
MNRQSNISFKMTTKSQRSQAAALLGSVKSPKKAKAARENGRKFKGKGKPDGAA